MDDDFDGAEVRVEDPKSTTATTTSDAQSKRKRKREKEKANKQANPTNSANPPKKTKKDSKDPELKPSKTVTVKDDGSINEDIAKMDPSLLADYVGQRLKHWEKSLSSIELEDKYLPASVFSDTTHWQSQRTLTNLPNYLEKCCRVEGTKKFRLDRAAEAMGSPHTLIITSAALRASHIASAVRKYQSKNAMIAKLFAKHIKLQESIEMCKNNRLGIAVGTPSRILEVLKEDVLKLSELRWVIVDASYVDKKGFGVFGIRETYTGIMEFFGHEKTKKRFEGGLKVLFF